MFLNFIVCFWTVLFGTELLCVELRFIVLQKTTPSTQLIPNLYVWLIFEMELTFSSHSQTLKLLPFESLKNYILFWFGFDYFHTVCLCVCNVLHFSVNNNACNRGCQFTRTIRYDKHFFFLLPLLQLMSRWSSLLAHL